MRAMRAMTAELQRNTTAVTRLADLLEAEANDRSARSLRS